MFLYPKIKKVCVHARAGDSVHGCPEGPVIVDHDVETCITAPEYEAKMAELHAEHPEFHHVVEELVPGRRVVLQGGKDFYFNLDH